MKITGNIKTLAMLLNTSVSMLTGYAHSMGFDWVNENSGAFYWLNDAREIVNFQFIA